MIHRILHEHFPLTFKKRKMQNINYNDQQFDDKRLLVTRLLAQFLNDDVLIISIDEAGFQQSLGKNY